MGPRPMSREQASKLAERAEELGEQTASLSSPASYPSWGTRKKRQNEVVGSVPEQPLAVRML